MIRMTVEIHTRGGGIDAYSRRMQSRVKGVIADDAQETLADARARSRVRTGRMKAGWTAYNLTPYSYELRNDVPYTIYNEYGTIHMSAQPMATPATEAARARLPRKLAEAVQP